MADPQLTLQGCKGTHKQLPFFDSLLLEVYLDDQRDLKRKVG